MPNSRFDIIVIAVCNCIFEYTRCIQIRKRRRTHAADAGGAVGPRTSGILSGGKVVVWRGGDVDGARVGGWLCGGSLSNRAFVDNRRSAPSTRLDEKIGDTVEVLDRALRHVGEAASAARTGGFQILICGRRRRKNSDVVKIGHAQAVRRVFWVGGKRALELVWRQHAFSRLRPVRYFLAEVVSDAAGSVQLSDGDLLLH